MYIPKIFKQWAKIAENNIGEQIYNKQVKRFWLKATCAEIIFSDNSVLRFDGFGDNGKYKDGLLIAVYLNAKDANLKEEN